MRFRTIYLAFGLWALTPVPGFGRQPFEETPGPDSRPEVLVLGVWHMGSAGSHVFETEADDVLSPRRQAEVDEVMAVLREFRPTKIAVEAAFHDDDAVSSRYEAYLSGERELTRNETDQIGLRLAAELGHETVYPVDADGEYPFPRLQDYAEARGHSKAFDALMAEGREEAEAWSAYLASHTVLEAMLRMNSEESVARRMAFDYRMAHLGEPWNWAGPDLVSDWFRRNMRIYSNVMQLIESPDERVLVVFGAGHLGWLRHDFATDPDIRLRKLGEFVGGDLR